MKASTRAIRIGAFVLLTGLACAADPAAALQGARAGVRDSAGVRIVQNPARDVMLPARRVASIGVADGDPKQILFNVFSVAIDKAGNHYIGMEAEIRVFDRNGRYVRTIGRKGKGPGEFGMPPFPIWFSGDSVLAMDRNLMRTTAFTPDGKVISSYSSYSHPGLEVRPIGRSSLSWIALVEPNIENIHDEAEMAKLYSYIKLAPGQVGELKPIELRRYYPRQDSLGDTVYRIRSEKIVGIKDKPGFTQRPFEDKPAYAVTSSGFVFAKVPSEYRIDVFDQRGRLVRSVRRDFTRIPIRESDFDGMPELVMQAQLIGSKFMAGPEAEANYRKDMLASMTKRVDALKKLPLPPSRHPVGRIFASANGLLWAERSDFQKPAMRAAFVTNARTRVATRWDVFDAAGAYVATTELPSGFRPMNVSDEGRVTGVFLDEDGVEFVVTYQVGIKAKG